jgi:multidrug efflux pump
MDEIKKTMPEGVEYRIAYDPTQFVRASIESVVHTLLEAILLVVLVVILFLQTWRASIIPLLAGAGVGGRHLRGAAPARLLDQCAEPVRLVLAIGIVVDDAIVVVENVERNIEAGPDAARGDLPRHARSVRGPSSPSRWCWSRCSCRWPSSAGSPGQFYRPVRR